MITTCAVLTPGWGIQRLHAGHRRSCLFVRSTVRICEGKKHKLRQAGRQGSLVTNSLNWTPPDSLVRAAACLLSACVACTSLSCDGASVLANKPSFSSDYAAVVRKREGKSKSNLPSSREAEALLEINEDLFTSEALEGMAR